MSQSAIDIYNLGYHYYTGTDGYPLNKSLALTYFQQAADLGVAHAMNYLGIIYEAGEFVPKDLKKAAVWFYKALSADNKNVHAAYNLAHMYYVGNGVSKDITKAFQYYKAAATMNEDNPHPQACYMVGVIYMEVYNNYIEAFKFLRKAAKFGNIAEAWHNLGVLTYHKGVTMKSNPYGSGKDAQVKLARDYYQKAIQQGYVDSMYALGLLYCQNGCEEEGDKWLKKAADLGNEPAKKLFGIRKSNSLLDLIRKL